MFELLQAMFQMGCNAFVVIAILIPIAALLVTNILYFVYDAIRYFRQRVPW